MGSTVFPAASAGKTMYRTTLTSGTSYTVPAGVTYLNVTLVGGGGGGGGSRGQYALDGFDGLGGQVVSSTLTATAGATITYAIGAGGSGGASPGGQGANGGNTTFTGATTASGGGGGGGAESNNAGRTGVAGICAANYGGGASIYNSNGGTGGAGAIYVEYWVQEIIMRTFAVIENNKVVNVIVGVEDEVVAANPGKYIDYTDGWDYNNGIDGGIYFPTPEVTE